MLWGFLNYHHLTRLRYYQFMTIDRDQQRRIYIDHAATTPPDPLVIEAMLPYLTQYWQNPSSIYVEAQATRQAIDQSRNKIADLIGAQPSEIIFTSGGTESNTLALRGVIAASQLSDKHIVSSATEHHAILDTLEQIELENLANISIIEVDKLGQVNPGEVKKAITNDTVLVTIMHANNEVGTINDIAQIAHEIREVNPNTLFHTDAVQSMAHLGANTKELDVDLLTFTGHKMYGPRGAGCLYVRNGTPLQAQIVGGGQEERRRAGTEDTAAIVGLAKALELTIDRRESDIAHEQKLQNLLLSKLPMYIPFSGATGPLNNSERLPGHASFVIGFVEGESILVALDLAGFAASSGSACTTGSIEPSHVLLGMGIPEDLARGSLRFSFGRNNSEEDVNDLLEILPVIVQKLRSLSPLNNSSLPHGWEKWLGN